MKSDLILTSLKLKTTTLLFIKQESFQNKPYKEARLMQFNRASFPSYNS